MKTSFRLNLWLVNLSYADCTVFQSLQNRIEHCILQETFINYLPSYKKQFFFCLKNTFYEITDSIEAVGHTWNKKKHKFQYKLYTKVNNYDNDVSCWILSLNKNKYSTTTRKNNVHFGLNMNQKRTVSN